MQKWTKVTAVLLLFCLMLGMAACGAAESKAELKATVEPPKVASDYAEVSKALRAQSFSGAVYSSNTYYAEEDGAKAVLETDAATSDLYSGTNVQVEGIDEADIIKTDGKYIYAMFGNTLKILRADGENTEVISQTELNAEDSENSTLYAAELYLHDQTLYLIAERSEWGNDDAWYWNYATQLRVYDVSNPEKPVLSDTYGQDGNYISSRLADGILYLISENYIYDDTFENEDWVPCTYCGGKDVKVPADRIFICPSASGTCLTTVSAFDCAKQTAADVCSFTGSVDNVYMNDNEIYLAQTSYQTLTSDPYTEKQYQVVDYKDTAMTAINRVSISDGKLTLTASGSVEGYLVNQFAMDAHNGTLRVATTTSSSSYSVYTDEAYDFENTKWGESKQENMVTVLDADLQVVGSLGNIAPDERIYSVRYFGDVVYLVTYESIDPVFAIDLSDPAKPTMLSALEVLGVSDYLHGFGEGQLFGLGRALDEDGYSNGLQLSMFDVSDPKNVTLITKTVVDEWYSEALYNHKAILISPEKNLICFPGNDSNYYVFRYTDGNFEKAGNFDLAAENDGAYWSWSTTRGLYIRDYLYMISDEAFCVVDLADFTIVKQITNAEG